jgi:predicted histidine transporter YuiF (NhaC family)
MAQSTIAGVITAIASVCTAVGLIITALTAYKKVTKVEEKVDIVHKIVNQQRTDAENYQRALIRALVAAGIKVPIDQSKEE